MNTMPVSRLSTPRDYLALIVRRKWLILFTFLGCLGVALVAVSVIPDMYVSESLILFRPGEVSTDLVKGTATEANTSDDRLTAIQETILSRSNLLRVIKEFQRDLQEYRGLSDDKKIERMRGQLEIELLSEKPRDAQAPVTHVRVRFREHNPELAQKIAGRLASLFVDDENRTREVQVNGTAALLSEELANVSARLAESGEKLKAIKERYRDQLPSQLASNLATLERLQLQKTTNAEALDRQTTLRLTLERQLAQTPPRISAESAAATPRKRNPLVDTYLTKEAEYKDLVAKATDKHPDVIRLRAQLDALRKSIPPEDFDMVGTPDQAQARSKTEINPLYQSLSSQLSQVKTEIDIRNRDEKWIESQIGLYSQKVQNTPQAEQEIASSERSNTELTKLSDDLKTKLAQAKIFQTIETRQQSAQFVIVDPANLPADPASPNRMMLHLGGIGLSFALAFMVGIVTDLSKRKIFTSAELERFLKTPVLVEIPRISSAAQSMHTRRIRLKYAAIFLVGAGVYAWGLHYLYSNQSYLLRVLDPIIQQKAGSTNAQK